MLSCLPSFREFRKTTNIALILCAFSASVLSAQTITVLHNFDNGTDGSYPWGTLVQGVNGDFYGTASGGGANSQGVVFKITPAGVFSTLYSFCSEGGTACTDGEQPRMGLILDSNGYLYGTTLFGGANNRGTVYKLSTSGKLTTLYSFCNLESCADGWAPYGLLLQASNGDLYGTTSSAGKYNAGTVFDMTTAGGLTTLHSFCATSGCPDGEDPAAGLIQAANGDFYGTTSEEGANGSGGTVFKLVGDTVTTLHSFCSQGGSSCTDGSDPNGSLLIGPSGNFYGVTEGGGADSEGTLYEITPGGALTTLWNFCSENNSQYSCLDGQNPRGGLILGSDGNFYGTTSGAFGTIYKITPSGALTTLATFDNTNGSGPFAPPVQGTNGDFYGTTNGGGAHGYGVIWSLSTGLSPFVQTLPSSGKVGASVEILGSDLTGATSVSFNGTAAVFKVASASEITTKVPSGATTGNVTVVTPSGALTSRAAFDVVP
jgi:uncharacterized repeat protein (TIGR03803 family)